MNCLQNKRIAEKRIIMAGKMIFDFMHILNYRQFRAHAELCYLVVNSLASPKEIHLAVASPSFYKERGRTGTM